VGEVAGQHRHADRQPQRDYVSQPRDEFGRPVPVRHADKPWHEYRPAIAAAAPSHPPPPSGSTNSSSSTLVVRAPAV